MPQPLVDNIIPVSIADEMRQSYLDYAMSVIISRALPDVCDGLKPVQRRILYTMKQQGYDSSKPYKKCARIVGDVMGQYHPHGDAAIYDALVRMGQNFSMNLPLIDGQGNFGSIDGDPAAAMRYTEARLTKISETLLTDIDKDTVPFQSNYDETTTEPTALPARFPNLLVNGASGIAVGMATNIPPHNLGEVIDACCAYIDDPLLSIHELMKYMPGPDFPTHAMIVQSSGLYETYKTGKGSILLQARTSIERISPYKEAIIVTEIPYQVNKSRLLERIAELNKNKKIEGLTDLRDESDRQGMRIVIELKSGMNAELIRKQLFYYTPLQTSFPIQMLALYKGRPILMTLPDILKAFISFREQVVTNHTLYELQAAKQRAQILIARILVLHNLTPILRILRHAKDTATARQQLIEKPWPVKPIRGLIALVEGTTQLKKDTYQLIEEQAQAILDLRLNRLTHLEREKVVTEIHSLSQSITSLQELLTDRRLMMQKLRQDLLSIKQQFSLPRRTEILKHTSLIDDPETTAEELIQREDMVVMVSHSGYIKRIPLSTYTAQRRGGKGKKGIHMKEEDTISDLFIVNTHTSLLLFSNRGMVYKLKVYALPLGGRQGRGKAIINLLPMHPEETITTVLSLPEDKEKLSADLIFATSRGKVRRNRVQDFLNIRTNGLIAIKMTEKQERVIGVQVCFQEEDIFLATRKGRCIRFPVAQVRRFVNRNTVGIRGIHLLPDDDVISLTILQHTSLKLSERQQYLWLSRNNLLTQFPLEQQPQSYTFSDLKKREQFLLTVLSNGYGKRTSVYEYRVTNRGGKGIKNMSTQYDTEIVSVFPVLQNQQIMLITSKGQMIRVPVDGIRMRSRITKGVIIFKISPDERVVKVARVPEILEDHDDHPPNPHPIPNS